MSTPRSPMAKAAPFVLLLALAAGLALWWRGGAGPATPAPDAEGEPPAVAAAQDGATTSAPATANAPSRPVPSTPLPSMAAPLALVIDELQARSDAGEADAACRLAAELAVCSQATIERSEYDRWLAERQATLGRVTDTEARRKLATDIEQQMEMRESMLENLSGHCANVPDASADRIAAQWRRAALLGNPAAMKQYASGNAFRWASIMDSLPALATYRTEAEAMALRVARDGDAGMLLSLAAGYDPSPSRGRSLLAQTLRPDGPRALAMYRRAQSALDALPPGQMARLRGQLASRTSALEATLSPEERVRADALAEQEFAAWAPPAFSDGDAQRQMGGQPDVHRFACGAPPGETVRRRRPPAS